MNYDEAKKLAADPSAPIRGELAQRADLMPEILYYLANDADAAVRRAVADNDATPRQADLLLAGDQDVAVREHLARKIDRLTPDLSRSEQDKIRDLTINVIETLARDQAVKVRQIVAEALKDKISAPPPVIQALARDIEILVAGPVLEHSPILSDEDLLDILSAGPIKGAMVAIARRREVSARLSDAIVKASLDDPQERATITSLLRNENAQIREDTLDMILEKAPEVEAWHPPLVERPKLPTRMVKRLAEFVSHALLDLLQARPDLDKEAAEAVAKTVRKRLKSEAEAGAETAVPVGEPAMAAALAAGKVAAVTAALARDSGLSSSTVSRILESKSAKAVTALAWRAKLPMRQALQLQLRVAGIPPAQVLNPRGGTDYPLTSEEMNWQLQLFGVG